MKLTLFVGVVAIGLSACCRHGQQPTTTPSPWSEIAMSTVRLLHGSAKIPAGDYIFAQTHSGFGIYDANGNLLAETAPGHLPKLLPSPVVKEFQKAAQRERAK